MEQDGSNPTRLTNNPAVDSNAAWSPDGTKIAFESRRDGNAEIYVMDANGSNPIRLTNNPTGDFFPAWSPDGTKITFTSFREGTFQVWVMNANGSNPTPLTGSFKTNDFAPDWSPDGKTILYESQNVKSGNHDVWLMSADGFVRVNLTNNPAGDHEPVWSPDGTKIAFASGRAGNDEVYVMNSNGSNPTNLTQSPLEDFFPAWSPDGAKIAFTSLRDGNVEIYVMDADGSNQTRLTNNPATDLAPDWQRISPSGPPAAQALNLSTRLRVQTGDNIGIGGFIITGSALKHVLIRAIGPSLAGLGVPNTLADPVLELNGPAGFATITNNDWRDDPVQEALIEVSGIAPTNDLESAIDANLVPGAYTAVVRGNDNTVGAALIEVYDLGQAAASKLANISTRAFVSTGNDIVIAGFILGNGSASDRIVVRGIGPSLADFGVPDVLANPTLELRDSNGALLIANNDWQDDPVQASEINAAGLAPTNALESGIAATLPPGLYTTLLAGLNNGTGNGVVEVYDRGAP
ncbi:MAG TPA: hypothetical protein VNP98_09055 [Chthoniobacterales bacterium]|nr:hypothetical protein [Chthoniobacterales bacterium]